MTGSAPPDDRLREAIQSRVRGRTGLLRRYAPRNDGVACGTAAIFLKQSRHRQSSPLTGIGRRAVSASHQHSPDRLHENSTPQRGQARRREAGFEFSNRLAMNGIAF
jgi:hypothetical protein